MSEPASPHGQHDASPPTEKERLDLERSRLEVARLQRDLKSSRWDALLRPLGGVFSAATTLVAVLSLAWTFTRDRDARVAERTARREDLFRKLAQDFTASPSAPQREFALRSLGLEYGRDTGHFHRDLAVLLIRHSETEHDLSILGLMSDHLIDAGPDSLMLALLAQQNRDIVDSLGKVGLPVRRAVLTRHANLALATDRDTARRGAMERLRGGLAWNMALTIRALSRMSRIPAVNFDRTVLSRRRIDWDWTDTLADTSLAVDDSVPRLVADEFVLKDATLDGTSFGRADLAGIRLEHVSLRRVKFDEANVSGATFIDVTADSNTSFARLQTRLSLVDNILTPLPPATLSNIPILFRSPSILFPFVISGGSYTGITESTRRGPAIVMIRTRMDTVLANASAIPSGAARDSVVCATNFPPAIPENDLTAGGQANFDNGPRSGEVLEHPGARGWLGRQWRSSGEWHRFPCPVRDRRPGKPAPSASTVARH